MRLLALLGFSLIFFPAFAFAQTPSPDTMALTPTPTPVDYPLAYPGILPDNPLYFLKVVRDKIVLFLITDPVKRAEFNLLQADKRLAAGVMLFDQTKDKKALAIETMSKGENYFHDAVAQAVLLKQEGRDVQPFLEQLHTASSKHLQIVTSLEQGFPGQKQQLDYVIKQIKTYQQQLNKALQ
ncbi:MAG TPA: DUF5667 domain-containing protein [Patescibacteria group bacterium]|nr:DUF5667 domain-containing protein [Patescibacteria group bacterium]